LRSVSRNNKDDDDEEDTSDDFGFTSKASYKAKYTRTVTCACVG